MRVKWFSFHINQVKEQGEGVFFRSKQFCWVTDWQCVCFGAEWRQYLILAPFTVLGHGILRWSIHGVLCWRYVRLLGHCHSGLEIILGHVPLDGLLGCYTPGGCVLHPLQFLMPSIYMLIKVVHVRCFRLIPATIIHFHEYFMLDLVFVP